MDRYNCDDTSSPEPKRIRTLRDCSRNERQVNRLSFGGRIANEVDQPSFTFEKKVGLLVPLPGKGNPTDFFFMLFDQNFFDILVNEINDYAKNNMPRSSKSKWQPTDHKEILTFIILIILTGTIKLKRLIEYWEEDISPNLPSFSKFMSHDRFLMLFKCFHFPKIFADSSGGIHLERFEKFRHVIDYFNNKMNAIYYPHKVLTLDDPVDVGQVDHIRQNKDHTHYIKLHTLTEPNGLILKCAMHLYSVKLGDLKRKCRVKNTALHLMSEKLNNGHSIYLDRYYNIHDLAYELLEKKTHCTGTSKFDHEQNYHLYSTEFENNFKCTYNKYKKYMKYINHKYQMLGYYPFLLDPNNWYKTLGTHVIQMLFLNAYILYTKSNIKCNMTQFEFRMYIIEEHLPGYLKSKNRE